MKRPEKVDNTIRKLNILVIKYGEKGIFDLDGNLQNINEKEFREFVEYIEKLERAY